MTLTEVKQCRPPPYGGGGGVDIINEKASIIFSCIRGYSWFRLEEENGRAMKGENISNTESMTM